MITRMPWVFGNPEIAGSNGEPCSMTAPAAALAMAWMALLVGRAGLMRCDERLVAAAQAHADYLASRTLEMIDALSDDPYGMHLGAEGSTANERARSVGYRLPDHYPLRGNHIESAARNGDDPAVVIRTLAYHASHHDHLFGLNWFAGHTVYGIGHAADDWVILAAPPES